jgi:hypothetical protein
MKKFLTVSLLLVSLSMAVSSFAVSSGPLRFCLWPEKVYWPQDMNIYGLTLGIGNCNGNDKENVSAGLDVGLISTVANFYGIRAGLAGMSEGLVGMECGAFMLSNEVEGMQISAFNMTEESSVFQIGVVNWAKKSSGFQLGLICIMDNGFLPWFPIFNFGGMGRFKEK